MILTWLGVALLSASWLFGLGYYHPQDWGSWTVLLLSGCGCLLAGFPIEAPLRRQTALASLLLCIPPMLLATWPHRAAVLLLMVSMLMQVLHSMISRSRRTKYYALRLATATLVAGSVLTVQSLVITWYTAQTSRSHELPRWLATVVGGLASLLGMDAYASDTTVALDSMRELHPLGATWELLLDPVTCVFLVSLIVIFSWLACAGAHQGLKSWFRQSLLAVAVSVVIWLPFRAGLMMAWYLHDVLTTSYDARLDAMRWFWNGWLPLILLAGPVAVCVTLGPRASSRRMSAPEESSGVQRKAWMPLVVAALAGLGVALVSLGILWDPVGRRQPGRVVLEEYNPHPENIWEPVSRPYDTTWYGQQAGYNYACIFDYCSRYFTMSRLTAPVAPDALAACDVLVIKVPTRRFATREIKAIEQFVRSGGGLLLIGEHTNVFHTTENLNPIARTFGFEFRDDCLFGIDSVFEQRYVPPLVPHPIVQHLESMDFATSCSIDPGNSSGRAAIRGSRLKNLAADYHSDNFYPLPVDKADMRYGAFIQLWVTRYGKGRVVAFTDSTVFSNFCVFEPGKSELMIGMIEWLNHRSSLVHSRSALVCCGLLLLAAGMVAARRWSIGAPLLLAAGWLGWAVAAAGATTLHQSMPWPEAERDFVHVSIDRTVCDSPLSKNGFVDGTENGFGIFERWILRLGYFTSRRDGEGVFNSDAIVYLRPDQTINAAYLRRLVEFVESGGKVLVLDDSKKGSSTNELLHAFGLAVDAGRTVSGPLQTAEGWPSVPVTEAAVCLGGEPLAYVDGQVVGAVARHGKGTVVVIGFGSRFADANMGVSGDAVPDAGLKSVFELQFALLRWLVESE